MLLLAFSAAIFTSCGDMSNNTNEDNTHNEESPIDEMNPVGSPNTTTAPQRDSYATDTTNNTAGPDNASPKSSAMDSTPSKRY